MMLLDIDVPYDVIIRQCVKINDHKQINYV